MFSLRWQLYLYNIILTAKLFVYSHFIISKPPVRRLILLWCPLQSLRFSKPPMRRLTIECRLLCTRIISKPPVRRLTGYIPASILISISKPPVRRLTLYCGRLLSCDFSKPPVRRLTLAAHINAQGNISKPPVRRLTAIISPRSLISCHLAPIILSFTFFLGNHKIPYYNCIHNIWKKTGKNL